MTPSAAPVLACFTIAGFPVCVDAARIRGIEQVGGSSAALKDSAGRVEALFARRSAPDPATRLLSLENDSPLAIPAHEVEFHPLVELEVHPWPPFLSGLTETAGCVGVVQIGQTLRYLLDVDRLVALCGSGGPA